MIGFGFARAIPRGDSSIEAASTCGRLRLVASDIGAFPSPILHELHDPPPGTNRTATASRSMISEP